MMDYYSQFDMPSLKERRTNLRNYANSLKNIIECEPRELDIIVNKIVSQTGNLSFTGYTVFGEKDERRKLENVLTKTYGTTYGTNVITHLTNTNAANATNATNAANNINIFK